MKLEAQQRQAQDAIATAEAQVAMRISEKAAAEAMVQQRETELMAAKNRLSAYRSFSQRRRIVQATTG